MKKTIRRSSDREKIKKSAEFDKEFIAETFDKPGPAAQEVWNRIKKKPGRPIKGRGAKTISVTVEKGLLERSDRLARKLRVTRAGLIARGLKAVLAAQRGA